MNTAKAPVRRSGRQAPPGKIHPVVIYPYQQPRDYGNLKELYRLVAQLDGRRDLYTRPITVMDGKTAFAAGKQKQFREFRERTVARCSDVLEAWCVDTCQMWYTGLGRAFAEGTEGDVYWLIPGDFNYGSKAGREVLGRLHDLPEIVQELDQDICIGEIAADHENPKQLIDTYGTFALMYVWFPKEAREIHQYTGRPRSEFFAVRHKFLRAALTTRWYAYEQTVVMLLRAVLTGKRISRFYVGDITDLPEGRETLSSAIQQVERTERVLKSLWRERHEQRAGWTGKYRLLEAQSEQVRRTALAIFENLLH